MNQEKFFEILQYAAAAADKAGELYPAEKRDIDDMLRYGRTATGATLTYAPRNEAELEALLLDGHGADRESGIAKWLDHVRNGGRFAKFPNLDAIKGHYADEIRLGDIGDWDEFEAYKLHRACLRICHLAGRHWLYSLATTSSPEAMAKGGTVASRMSESVRAVDLLFLYRLSRDEDAEILSAFLAMDPGEAPELPAGCTSFDFAILFVAFKERAMAAYAGRLDEVTWTQYPDFQDWCFSRFLAEHPGAADYENYLDAEAIEREYSCYYTEKNGFIFRRHA